MIRDVERENKINLIQLWCSIVVAIATLCIVLFVPTFNSFFKILMVFVYAILGVLPYILQKIFKVILPIYITIPYYIFIVLSTLLGTIFGLYDIVFFYDLVLHSISGILLAGLGLYVYTRLNGKQNFNIGIAIFIMVGMAIIGGVLWEIWEYITDDIFALNSQRHTAIDGTQYIGHDALKDTMNDLISDFVGSVIFALGFTIYYLKQQKNKPVRSVRKLRK